MYEIYRIVIYYRFLWWLIEIKRSPRMMPGKACYEMAKMLNYPGTAIPADYKEDFLKYTFVLTGSRKYRFGKRIRLIVPL